VCDVAEADWGDNARLGHGSRLAIYGRAGRLDRRLANQRALANRGLQRGGELSVTTAMSASRSLPIKLVAGCRSIHKYGKRRWPRTPPASCLRTGDLPQRPPMTSPPRVRIERIMRRAPRVPQRTATAVADGQRRSLEALSRSSSGE